MYFFYINNGEEWHCMQSLSINYLLIKLLISTCYYSLHVFLIFIIIV